MKPCVVAFKALTVVAMSTAGPTRNDVPVSAITWQLPL